VDPRFGALRIGNALVERLYTGMRWAEGPVHFGDGGFLVWSDIPNDRLLRFTAESGAVSVFRQPSRHANGNTRDRQGRLVTCEHGARRVTRTEHDGRLTILAERFEGKRLNSPNDVVVHSDGGVWFTDPTYGIRGAYEGQRAEQELPTGVYRLDPQSGRLDLVADDLLMPNGLAFSPDESRLYVADTGIVERGDGPPHLRVFDVAGGARLRGGRVFASMRPAFSDGVRVDVDGNVWTSAGWAGSGSDGELLGRILLPEVCANLCFGGPDRNRLFMTASTSLYSVYVNTRGAGYP
jgi:gluconolactonase